MDIVSKIRKFLIQNNLDYLFVNSTNEFLVEYNDLQFNSRYFLTNFSGSCGEALLTLKNLYLFVDGRYHTQADLEVDKNTVSVVKLKTGDKFIDKFCAKLKKNSTLGIISKKVSQYKLEMITKALSEKNIKIKLIDIDPILENKKTDNPTFTNISKELCGKTTDEKVNTVSKDLKSDEAILVTNLEEVSYIFNKRDFSKTNSASINAKALITKDNVELITNKLETYTKPFKKVFVDKKTINAFDYKNLGNKSIPLKINPITLMKSIKNDEEINHYLYAFKQTDKALFAIREFINNSENISEFDIAERLEKEFLKNGAKSLSFTSIVAKDKNSALAHYSKSSKNEIIEDGSLVLIDCGAYFEGGLATDITRVFVKGTPSNLQKEIYTCVLKAFLNAFNTKITKTTDGFKIDNNARRILAEIAPLGFVFNHGLGHGIGVSVHESPPRLAISDDAKIKLKENMCFTIEPGLYNKTKFGIRLENSCYLKNNKINSFTNMCFEKNLINFDLLSTQEKSWLNNFEVL